MQDSVYHVLLDGGQVGPYDRRTIVGMRIRKALRSRDVVVAADGRRLTVRELVHKPAEIGVRPEHNGSYSVVQAIHAATLVEVDGPGCCVVPPFRGDLEVRVQTRVLRIEGRHREGRAWKQDRLKIPLEQVVHAGVRGRLVDLGLVGETGAFPQRLTLDLRTPAAAADLVAAMPNATDWPAGLVVQPSQRWAWAANPMALAGAAAVTVLVTVVVIVVWAAAR